MNFGVKKDKFIMSGNQFVSQEWFFFVYLFWFYNYQLKRLNNSMHIVLSLSCIIFGKCGDFS